VKPARLRQFAEALRSTPLHPQWLHASPKRHLPELGAIGGGVVLDVGCADQWVRKRLAAGADYVSLDYPAIGAVRYAATPRVFGDAQALPIRSASVDAVTMLEVIEHLPDPDKALAEAHRVLRPGGILVLSAPFAYPLHDQPHDYRRFTPHGLAWMLSRHGFQAGPARPVGGTIAAAALGLNLAIAAAIGAAMQRSLLASALLVPALPLVLAINLGAWVAERLLPESGVLTAGYVVLGRRAETAGND
jgi:SAM-dependent methyltransferase